MSIIKGTNQIVAGFGGTKRSIGEVYFSQSSLATDNSGALPLFTGETITSANTIYPDFYNWVLAHTELQCTSEEYENALSTYGECPKYVIGDGTLRLPKLSNYIKAANTAEGITQKEAGLPDHYHKEFNTTFNNYGNTLTSVPDSFVAAAGIKRNITDRDDYNLMVSAGDPATPNAGNTGNASASNPIYGKSSTVTPAYTTLYPWVVAYAAAIPASTAQAAEFQQGLSGKADTNLGNVASNLDYVVDSYKDANGNWYRKYKSGWVEQGGQYRTTTTQRQTWGVITFLKPFTDTNYTVQAVAHSPYRNTTLLIYMSMASIGNKTTTKVDVGAYGISDDDKNNGFDWIACGQGAN